MPIEFLGAKTYGGPSDLTTEVRVVATNLSDSGALDALFEQIDSGHVQPSCAGAPHSRWHKPQVERAAIADGIIASISDTTIWRWF